MAVRWPDCANTVAGVAADVGDHGGGVVGVGPQETNRRMAVGAFRGGIRMRGCGCLANRHGAVMAIGTQSGNSAMIKTAVRVQRKETGGVVAVVAFSAGGQVRTGFTYRQNPVMASAAIAKYFLMIDKRDNVETQGGMTGLAHIAGGDVIRRFPGNLTWSR